MKNKLYMAVTDDQYELPVFIEDTMTALAEKVGVDTSTICKHIRGHLKGTSLTGYKFVKVRVME